MTTITLTRPPSVRPEPLERLVERLTRRLHARVRPVGVSFGEDGTTDTLTVTAAADLVRLACAAEVPSGTTWAVTP
jgi:hypothetical protein